MRVLIADQDAAQRHCLTRCFEECGWQVADTPTWSDGERAYRDQRPNLVLLHLAAAGEGGYAAIRQLRHADRHLAIIAYGAGAGSGSAIASLSAGADDYLPTPFDLEELKARALAVLRRSHQLAPTQPICIGPLEIDDRTKQVKVDGVEVNLSPKEYQLLRLCAEEPGRVFSRKEILQCLWPERAHDGNDIKQYVHLLRSKLANSPAGSELIENVKGFGYRLAVPATN